VLRIQIGNHLTNGIRIRSRKGLLTGDSMDSLQESACTPHMSQPGLHTGVGVDSKQEWFGLGFTGESAWTSHNSRLRSGADLDFTQVDLDYARESGRPNVPLGAGWTPQRSRSGRNRNRPGRNRGRLGLRRGVSLNSTHTSRPSPRVELLHTGVGMVHTGVTQVHRGVNIVSTQESALFPLRSNVTDVPAVPDQERLRLAA